MIENANKTEKLQIFESFSEKETYEFAKALGEKSEAGDVYTLSGDLGVGKTIFSKGIAAGLAIEDAISSPTFTIVQEYDSGRLPLYHFDVYRIGDPSEMDEVGFDDYVEGQGVVLIEWAELIEEILPERRTEITIEKDPSKGFDYRKITILEKK